MSTQPTDRTMILDLSKQTPAELDASLANLDAAIRTLSNPETMFSVGAELASAEAARQVNETLLPLNAPDAHAHNPKQTVAEALAGIKAAVRGDFWPRPLVMHFQGDFRDRDLKRRFNMIGLSAYSTCTGEVHVRELRGNTKLERLRLLEEEIWRLRNEHENDCLQYDMDEQASGDEP